MSEAPNDVVETDLDTTQVADPNTPPTDDTADAGLSAEDRAMAMGWTPQAQFKGDPAKWVDAETFVKRGEEFLPFLRANNRRLEQALERANTKMAGLEKAVATSIQHISRADARALAKAKADLDAELAQYAAAGDVEGVKAVNADIVALEKDAVSKTEDAAPDEPPEFTKWKADNPWYGTDKALTAAAVAIGNEVFEEGYTGKAQAKEVDKRLREQFPAKFAKPTNPLRNGPAAVEGGTPLRGPSGKTYSDLPAEAKAMCDQFVRDIKGFTREKFVKTYDWS